MDTFQTRIVAAILLLVLTFVVGFVPPYVFEYFARRARARKLARRKARSIARFHTPRTVAGDTASDQISEGDDDSTGHVIKRRSRSNSICSTDSIASRANLSSTKILQAFMFFGGGVLLATCFCHLIPEARENFNSYMKKHGGPLETAHVHSHTPMPSHLHDPNDGHIETGLSRLRPNATSAVLYAEDGTIDGHNHPSASDRDLITANPPINHSPSEATFNNGHASPYSLKSHDHADDQDAAESDHSGHTENHDQKHGKHAHAPPYIEISICAGFFLIYLLEELVHSFIGHHDHDPAPSTIKRSVKPASANHESGPLASASLKSAEVASFSAVIGPTLTLPTPAASPAFSNRNHDQVPPYYDNYAVDLQSEANVAASNGNRCNNVAAFVPSVSVCSLTTSEPNSNASLSTSGPTLPVSVRFLRGFIIIIAFSAHSIFDGVTIAVQTNVAQIWTMLAVILLHKLVVAFAVGLQLFEETASLAFTAFHMLMFSAMSPIGILLVIGAQGSSVANEDSSLTLIILSAVATGTILYIVFFEILKRDESKPGLSGFILWVIMLAGFLLMLCVTVFLEH